MHNSIYGDEPVPVADSLDGRTDEDTSSYGGFTGTKYLDSGTRYKAGDGFLSDGIDSSTYGVHPPSGLSETRQPSEAECDLHMGPDADFQGIGNHEDVTGGPSEARKLQHQRSRASGKKEYASTIE